ncbi:MAG: hypothetical protein ACHQ7N_18630 [Candidatus Methylomirabilales bacterium]
MGVAQLKAAIRNLKEDRVAALQSDDPAGLGRVRLRIKRMKWQLRRLREAS